MADIDTAVGEASRDKFRAEFGEERRPGDLQFALNEFQAQRRYILLRVFMYRSVPLCTLQFAVDF